MTTVNTRPEAPAASLEVRADRRRFLMWSAIGLAMTAGTLYFAARLIEPDFAIDTSAGRLVNLFPVWIRVPFFFLGGGLFAVATVSFIGHALSPRVATLSSEGIAARGPTGWKRWPWADIRKVDVTATGRLPQITVFGPHVRWTPWSWLVRPAAIPLSPMSDASLETVLAYIARFRPDLIPDRLRTKAGLS